MTSAESTRGNSALEMVSLTIDDHQIVVPTGTLVIRAAEFMGIQIPRFCDHPLLDPVGACRQCLVEVEGQRKPLASCTTAVTEDMVVRTQFSSATVDDAQRGVMELLLINHPLDCPVCDKGGECPLQNQAMSSGGPETRFDGAKRTYPKPINLSTQVLLDRERCVLCARCTRFSEQIAGDPFIEMLERGAQQQVGTASGQPFESYFSGNTVQICPVGALTGTAYRFRARPFDLVSSPSVCEHCASGCVQRTDHRHGRVLRRLAGDDPDVNEEWNCDKGRWAFSYPTVGDRITTPLLRDTEGVLRPAAWSEAIGFAAEGLAAAKGRAGVLVGGRLTVEDAYMYSKFARIVLGTNDIDFRARPHSAEEAEFLAARVAGTPMTVTYADLERAPTVLLVGFEPEEEAPIVFLRLRKAVRKNGLAVIAVAPFATTGLTKCNGRLVMTAPGNEASALEALSTELPDGTIILAGERLATSTGAYSAVARLADSVGASVAWIPRRAGDRGALEAGCLPNLLPGGRPVSDSRAREQTASAWRTDGLPTTPGRDTGGILMAAAQREITALLVAGVEPGDLPDPAGAVGALSDGPFVVSLEMRESAVTERADVVLPVSPVVEKTGSFRNWEGRVRQFRAATPSNANSDLRVLHILAERIGVDLACPTPVAAAAELSALGSWSGRRPATPDVAANPPISPVPGQALLAGWRMLLDSGRLQDGEPHLAGTARTTVVRLSPRTAAEIGASDGDPVTVRTDHGSITLPLVRTDMPDRVVWLPVNSSGCAVRAQLGAGSGEVVDIERGAI
ncbi:NADH-quinone oxidoreductase subunit G [Mycolicibacterium holsaticum]|uniref:NADH-quinone oxidoreductase n=2 Tax=Mycolicibacterium TaxID=1866885 RepID=A0A1E3R5S7_9MYCO|nr:NADH-quinone oxidoreductase subunit G [Mycolicibacterium holsaticum]ODQ85081.1 NADH-quinone oxidoreductase subunit G [Mycolicibacterium holsaticum]